jgi:hypothetical protein
MRMSSPLNPAEPAKLCCGVSSESKDDYEHEDEDEKD